MPLNQLRPFDESIVLAIEQVHGNGTAQEMIYLMDLIQKTKIPKNHDSVLAALDRYWDFPGATKWAREIRQTRESLIAQQQEQDKVSADKIAEEMSRRNITKIIKETNGTYGVVRTERYGSNLGYIELLFKIAKQDFRNLKASDVDVVHYGGDTHPKTFGIEFLIPIGATVPDDYIKIDYLEFTY